LFLYFHPIFLMEGNINKILCDSSARYKAVYQ
jgi:hypothetical protein